MRGALAAAAALGCVTALAGCGGAPGDILGLGISGGQQKQAVRMHVEENGRASCNKNQLHQLTSAEILTARNIARDAKTLAQTGASFGNPGSGQRNFQLRTPDGTVNWTEAAPGVPPVLPQAEVLALQMERQLC
ncbi:MAG TPA: hypothetical protein VH817_04525 [Thermoleophilaceae bacterium]|jgi:hypothetical protein